jgi:hypothetical protein|uniref:Uncharacterized protein n=1 Tax=viral metagenome TaxID=1070528 RepID=A0A6H1ZBI6_9ZZZZ
MTIEEMAALFEKHDDAYLRSTEDGPRDLAAIIRLQNLAPVNGDVVSASEHDQFWLAFDEEKVAEAITEEDVVYLKQRGLLYEEGMGFSFFA